MTRKSAETSHGLLWKAYFRDPSQWLDKRHDKLGPAYPDFKHKVTRECLWIDSWFNPSWVSGELRRRGFLEVEKEEIKGCDKSAAFVGLLRGCAKNKDLYRGIKLHDDISERGLLRKCSDALVTMYAKCGALAKAKELLNTHTSKDVFTWTSVITGYIDKGQGHDAIGCFEQMRHEGLYPDAVTFLCILKACGCTGAADMGEQIHDELAKKGLLREDIMLGNALVDMYAKCGALMKAQQVLEELCIRDVVAWNALIGGYVQHEQCEQALDCFEKMKQEGISPDTVTFIFILKACGSMGASSKGREIHEEISKVGLLEGNLVLGTTLVDMYAKCGLLQQAQRLIEELPVRDVVSWSALIAGYAQQGQGEQAFNCFEKMQGEGFSPNATTFTSILKACGSIRAIECGEKIHDELNRQGLPGKNVVVGNALVDMYAKCGAVEKAAQVLEELPVRDVVSWTTLIAGYAQQGQSEDALKCFESMQCEGLSPNGTTFASILKACGSIGAAKKGEKLHDEIARLGWLESVGVCGNALVDMYAKCGALTKAQQVLEELPIRDIISWNALISGCAQQGHCEHTQVCLERMQCEGFFPNRVTFICILKVCGSIGAIHWGQKIHDEIARQGLLEDGIVLGNNLVDMYAKCGTLAKAREVFNELPLRTRVSWNALITGYAHQSHCEQALNCLMQMQSEGLLPNGVTYICILKACGSIGAVHKGEQVHHEIAKQGFGESEVMIGVALVDMYAKCGVLQEARGLLKELPVRLVVSWNALIVGYVEQGEGEEALVCYEQMQHCDGLCPDLITFVHALKACGSIGAADKGDQIHCEIARHGLVEDDGVISDALIGMYAKCGLLQKAQAVFEELSIRTVSSWNALIGGYAQQGRAKQALACFEWMQCESLTPDAASFSLILRVCNTLGLVDDAQTYLVHMSTTYGITPHLEHYNHVVHLYGRVGHLPKAIGLSQMVPAFGSAAWLVLLLACEKWGVLNFGRWAFDNTVQIDKIVAAP